MLDIDYSTFDRLLTRAEEIVNEPDVNRSVKRVFDERLREPGAAFRAAHAGLTAVETRARKEGAEGRASLAAIDAPYRIARAVAFSYVPTLLLPVTLKKQPTDTDKMNAIGGLLRVLDERDETDGWAADQLAGDFGRLAPDTIREIEEWIQANKDLQRARDARVATAAPAYERFIAFKDVVRQAYGSKSKQYKRIHVRAAAAETEADPTE